MHHNIVTTQNKSLQIANYAIDECKADVISLNETRLAPSIKLRVADYIAERKDRNRKGGGVCLLIRPRLKYTRIDLSEFATVEAVAIELESPNGLDPLVIASYYNPPDKEISRAFLDFIAARSSRVVLVGDFNAHNYCWGHRHRDRNGDIILDFASDYEKPFLIVNAWDDTLAPTYVPVHHPERASVLDLVLTSELLEVEDFWVEQDENLHSDHMPIHVSVRFSARRAPVEKRAVELLNRKRFNEEFTRQLQKTETRLIDTTARIDEVAACLVTAAAEARRVATLTKQISRHTPLELPQAILNLIRRKRWARRKFRKSHVIDYKVLHNRLAAEIKRAIKAFKQKAWQDMCSELGQLRASESTFWRRLAHLSGEERGRRSIPKLKCTNGERINEPATVSNAFAANLATVFQPFEGPEYDETHREDIEDEVAASDLFTYPDSTLIVEPQLTTVEEVAELLKGIKGRGAPGEDGITNKVLKNLPVSCLMPIVDLINASIRLNYVPVQWKKAMVVMIPKPGKDHSDVNSHRPISLLSTISKLCERVILARLDAWQRDKITKYQCGFMRNRETKDQILRVMQIIQANLNTGKGNMVGMVFLDLEKAFDKVWHAGLLHKLNRLQIPAYLGRWIKSYLSDRSFIVKVGDAKSSAYPITAGVPQGSVLGPHLFNIFINDLVDFVFENTTKGDAGVGYEARGLALYADDTAVWKAGTKKALIEGDLQRALDLIAEWIFKWRLKVNTKKTVYNVFQSKDERTKLNLFYGATRDKLELDPCFRFLGVHLDTHLTMQPQVRYIKQRAQSKLNLMRRVSGQGWGVSPKLLIHTYQALIRSVIDYCPFTSLIASKTDVKTLEVIQNKAYRIATRWPRLQSNASMYRQYKAEPIAKRHKRLAVNYLTKRTATNPIVKELVDYYKVGPEHADGAAVPKSRAKAKRVRKTVLGRIFDAAAELAAAPRSLGPTPPAASALSSSATAASTAPNRPAASVAVAIAAAALVTQ